jgi:hypothetical protein
MDDSQIRCWSESGLRHILTPGALSPRSEAAAELGPPFNEVLAKAKMRPRFALTYFALGDDLGGRSDPGRRELWSGLIAASAVMSGKTVFAPCTAVSGESLRLDADSFWRLLGQLSPRHLLVFGPDAAEALFPFAGDLGETFFHRNLTVTVFPGPDRLMPYPNDAALAAAERIKRLG